MSQTPNCPSRQDLKQFLLGQSENDVAVKVEQHVIECPACVATLHGLHESDTIVEAVRRGAADSMSRLPEPDAGLVGKLCQLFPTTASSGSSPEATAEFAADRGAVDTPSQTGPTAGGEVAQEVLSVLAPPLEPGEIGRLGPYRVLKILGAGGMGVVFQAEDPQLKRLVALKVMKPTLAAIDAARKRFVREAQATAAIEHDHIVGIYQVAEDRGVPFIAMQFLRGESLEDRLKRERTLTLDESLRIAREIADGLAAAHEHGLMHRDIKPANVWLESKSEPQASARRSAGDIAQTGETNAAIPSLTLRALRQRGRVKLLDFGLARAADDQQHLTQSGAIAGTPAYMAPEQAQGEAVDHRCDLFSLGCVLYRMLTGEQPFHGKNTMAVLLAITQQTPRPVRELNPKVPEGVEKLVSRLLEKDPAKRLAPATKVIEIIAAIEQKLAELPANPITHQSPQRQRGSEQSTRVPGVEPRGTSGEPPAVATPKTEPLGARRLDPSHPAASPSPLGAEAESAKSRRAGSRGEGWSATRRRPLLAGLAAAAVLFALGGVVYRITTDRGELIINCHDEAVEVTITRNGKPVVEGLEVKHGQAKTTVRSGDIEVLIRGDHADEFTVTSNQSGQPKFVLSRNGRSVVEIERKLTVAASPSTGWHGWPADAPPPAIAPFDAATAQRHQEAWAKYLQIDVEFTNSLGMKFRLIPPGEFTMGSTPDEIEAALKVAGEDKRWQEYIKSEAPKHKVILTQPIYLGVYEVTQADYEKVMGKNPSYFATTGPDKVWADKVAGMDTTSHPVEGVSWNDAAEFCAKLSQQEKLKPFYFRAGETVTPLDGTGYRLPSEAEWEFACRAGTTTKYWIGDKDEDLIRADWFGTNSGDRTHAVGVLQGNPFGLYDIHGNVWEWVQDQWEPTYYRKFQEMAAIDPDCSFSAGSPRVIRGGGWGDNASSCRASSRFANDASFRCSVIGFRVSLVWGVSRVAGKDIVMSTTSDPDRRAAEWVLSIGGTVGVNGEERVRKTAAELPKESFQLKNINLLDNQQVSDAGLVHFKDCKNLTSVGLNSTKVTDAGLAHFKNCKNITHLDLTNTKVGDAGLANFKDCKDLTFLELFNTKVSDTGLAHFKNCKNLTYLQLGATQVSDAGMAHFEDCKNLWYLNLGGTQVSDAGLVHFKDCKLTQLNLSVTQVTDAGLVHFKNCKNLTSLNLGSTKVSDAGLAHFKDSTTLTWLNLGDTTVSDAGLAHFKNCTNLTYLNLNNILVSDDGLAYLKDCKNLTILILRRTKVTTAGIDEMKKALPLCKIEWDGGVIEPTAAALVPPRGASPLAALRREAIARYELAVAGFGDVGKAPAELVAVLGDSRLKHWAEVRDVEYSPDGRRIATASSDGTLKIWDAENADQQLVLRGHAAAVISLKWNRDGSTLASGSHDQTLKLWDAATGNERLSIRLDTKHPHGAFDRDNRRLVGGGPKARIFDAGTGDVLHTFEHNNVRLAAWSRDGTKIATGSDADRTIKIWDSATFGEIRSLPFGRGTIRSLAFSPNDELLVAGADGGPATWQVADGVERKIFDGVPGENWGVAFSRDGEQFALSSGFRKLIRRWNAKTWQPTGQIETNDHIWGLDFSGDGKTLAVAESAGFLRLIDAGTGQPRESPEAISGFALTPDGRTLGTISGEATVKLWDTATGLPTRTLAEHSAPLTSLAISPDGETIVAGSMDNTVRMWRVADGGASVTLGGHADAVMNVAISRDGQLLASGSSDKTARIWDLKTRKVRHTLTGFSHSVVRLAFSPDTRLLATAAYPTPYSHQPVPEIRLWDVSTGKELGKLAEHKHWVTALTFTEDSQRLAAASMDGTVRIYDVADGRPGKALLVLDKHPNWVFSITFSPDGATLVSGGGDGTLRLWSTTDGSLRREIPIGPTGGHRQLAGGGLINGILFAPDGSHVLTLNGNRTVYVLRLAAPADADR